MLQIHRLRKWNPYNDNAFDVYNTPRGFVCNSIVNAADSSPRSMLHMMDSCSNMLDEALYENEWTARATMLM